MNPSVYLCGSITKDPKCFGWRDEADSLLSHWPEEDNVIEVRLLEPTFLTVLDPCRGKQQNEWTDDGLEAIDCIYSNGAFVSRDRRDVKGCDVLLCCWWGDPGRQSIGTWMEFGWASAWEKPIVFVDLTEDKYNTKHPFVYKQSEHFGNLEDGCAYIRWLLLGKTHE